jgi:hypothetical protein
MSRLWGSQLRVNKQKLLVQQADHQFQLFAIGL